MTTTHPTAAQPGGAAAPSDLSQRLLQLLQRRVLRAQRKVTSDSLAPWVRAVTPDVSSGTRPDRRYWADCYRRACDYVLAHTPGHGTGLPIDGLRLVHGVCADARGLWAHAWADLPAPPGVPDAPGASGASGALVFDGVRQQFYDRDGYCRVLHAVAEASYDAPAMIEHMRTSGRYGPWHTGVLGRSASRRHRRLAIPTIDAGRPPPVQSEPESRSAPRRQASAGTGSRAPAPSR